MLPSLSGIIAGAIQKGENIYLHRGIVPGLTRWVLVVTATIIIIIIIIIINLFRVDI